MAENLILDRHAMKDPSTSHLRIYVGGIPDGTSIDDVYAHFIKYGKINGVIVNRNFGFVQFDSEVTVQEVISKANGTSFKERNLIVKPAQTNPDKSIYRRDPEVITVHMDTPPAVALPLSDIVDEATVDESYEGIGGRGRGIVRGRGLLRGIVRGRGGLPNYRDRSPMGKRGDWQDRPYDLGPYEYADYHRTMGVADRNDCEIIVVAKSLTEYAEFIEGRLKRLGIVVDLLFPMEDVPIGKVLGNIASRGCLYAILVMPPNQENRSLTLTILHGLPQEHRNMPLEDALQLISRNFQEVQRGGATGREAVYALLGQLADGRTLTVSQYNKVIEYLQERREQQIKVESGETTTPAASKTEVELQQRILSILNDKKPPKTDPPPIITPGGTPAAPQNKLLNDPTVRKALDSILQKFIP